MGKRKAAFSVSGVSGVSGAPGFSGVSGVSRVSNVFQAGPPDSSRHARGAPLEGELPQSVAAVDLGSNSFHMIVARTEGAVLAVVDRLREMVRLASGLDDSRKLSGKARHRALECLQRFGERLAHMPPGSVRAVGTNTLRSAHNAGEFLEDAENALGHPIETISGIEEARLIYLGASHSLQDHGARRLVLDIGGGSTEVIVGKAREPLAMDSLYMGCVSMSRLFFPKGRIDAASWTRAALYAQQELEPIHARYRRLGWAEAIGTSGTIRAVDAVVRAAGWSKKGITPKSLQQLRDALIAAGHERKVKLEGLNHDRRPVFAGGVVLLQSALGSLGVERIEPSDGALREGLIHDLLGRMLQDDVRDPTVAALAERHHVDIAQAERVEQTALQLLGQVQGDWRLTEASEPHRFLGWGARLHETGLGIAHAQHHKHGEYIVAQSDLAGFSRDEQRLLATLVRAHRRKFPIAVLRETRGKWSRSVERLCILLRLAVIMHRSRSPTAQVSPELRAQKRALKLRFSDGWLETHPLIRGDLAQEKLELEAAGYQLDFE